MEKKKLKKLVLKKDVVYKLENDEMHQMRGGASGLVGPALCDTVWYSCVEEKSVCEPCTGNPVDGGYYGGGGSYGGCSNVGATCNSCGPIDCNSNGCNSWQYTQCTGGYGC